MQDKLFYCVCFGFGAGVLWRSLLPFDAAAALFLAEACVFLICYAAFLKNKAAILVSVFTLAFALGVMRFAVADVPAPAVFQQRIGESVSLSGTIVEKPEEKGDFVQIVVETREDGATTRILLSARDRNAVQYMYGDELHIVGKLEPPTDFTTDQGKIFDYINYLKEDGIYFVMRHPKIEIVAHGGGGAVKRALFAARDALDSEIDAVIPKPESGLMRGLILGERASFSEPLRQAFVSTGLIHIVAVSGYNVTLVAGWILALLAFLPKTLATATGIAGILLYVIMTGGGQTAIRAGIMASMVLVARMTGRLYDAGRALLFAGVVMILINPFILVFDVSFQLSFLATIAIIFLAPRVEQHFQWIPWRWLRSIVTMTIAAYLFVLPFILYRMGTVSLVALPANFAVLPFIPATMILGIIVGIVGLISGVAGLGFLQGLAAVQGAAAYVLLHYELGAIGFFARLPLASFSVADFPLALVIFAYAIFFWYLTGNLLRLSLRRVGAPKAKPPERRFGIPIAAVALVVSVAGFLSYRQYNEAQAAQVRMHALLATAATEAPVHSFEPDPRTKSAGCVLRGPLPDRACTPGAIFEDATVERICVRGYTKTVRNVSTKLRKQVFAEYGISYPQPRGAYEVDHLIPLAIGGSNDIANLFPEAADPPPGFHEKDVVEVYLQQEVCSGRVALPAAQKQVAEDWLVVYDNLTPEEIRAIKKKYGEH